MNSYGHILFLWGREVAPWIPILLVVALLAYLVVRILGSDEKEASTQETPLDMLKRRYARGEITPEEYEQAQGQIMEQRPPSA